MLAASPYAWQADLDTTLVGPVLALVGFFIYTYKRHLDRQAKQWREQSRSEPGDYLDR